jgi:hypothetical protein
MNFLESLENTNKNQRISREIKIFENTYNP